MFVAVATALWPTRVAWGSPFIGKGESVTLLFQLLELL